MLIEGLRIVDPATSFPVNLAEARAQLRITDTSSDVLINILIGAATEAVQGKVQRCFVEQSAELVMACWAPRIDLPIAPVTAEQFGAIKYVDWTTQAQLTLDPSKYVVQTAGPTLSIIPTFGSIWPQVYSFAPEPIVISFDVGQGASDIKGNIKAAILMMVRHLYSLGESNLFVRRDMVFGLGEKQIELQPGVADVLPGAVLDLIRKEIWSD